MKILQKMEFDVISSGKAKASQTFLYDQFTIESDEARVGKTQHQLQAIHK